MANVSRSSRAQLDLFEIWEFIAEDSVTAADRFLDKIGEKCTFLASFPEAGESRPEFGNEVRVFPVGNYVIFYRPTENGIEVARVLHGGRDFDALFLGHAE